MDDKSSKGVDGESDKKSKEGKWKRLRSSIKKAACIGGGRVSPDGEFDQQPYGGPTSPAHSHHSQIFSHSTHGNHGHGHTHGHEKLKLLHPKSSAYAQSEDEMLDDILGEPDAMTLDIFSDVEDRFPDEMTKTFIALLVLGVCFVLNTISLVMTHERLQLKRSPLPDIFLDNVPAVDAALYAGEICIMVATLSAVVLMALHRHRWIVFRRCFAILSVLYLLRAVTMYVTVLPVASYTYHCDPKMNSSSFVEGSLRVLKLVSGLGLSINGQHTFCGDYIYSGHTVILVMAFLIIQEYSPRSSWQWSLLHWTYGLLSLTGVILVMVARGHYTVDVLVAYYITTRVFWIYHTLANRADLKSFSETNFLSRVFWFRYFLWLEGNVQGIVPHKYALPFTKEVINFDDDDDD